MIGHLEEISPWCKFQGNAWVDPHGRGKNGWEELPYWLKGYGDLGYVLKDEAIIRETRHWLDGMLASQQPDGWFGPRDLKGGVGNPFDVHLKGADMWPMMLALNCLQSYYEQSGDRRVLDCLTRYFRFQLSYPEARLLGCFADVRKGDNLESVYWLYNRTGEPWLLDLAKKIHRCGADWTAGSYGHGVNFTQGFREPGEYSLQGGHEIPPGHGAELPDGHGHLRPVSRRRFRRRRELAPGYVDPRQGFETCSWVELMHSFEMLMKMSGQPVWADRCEEIAFNSLPGLDDARPEGPPLSHLPPTWCSSTTATSPLRSRTEATSSATTRGSIAAASTTSPTAGLITPKNSGWRPGTVGCALRSMRPPR